MAEYEITLVVQDVRLDIVKKKVREVLGVKEGGGGWSVKKLERHRSRGLRFDDARNLIEEGKYMISDLKDEMEEWRDSIPENLQGGDKYQEVSDCADNLENICNELDNIELDCEFPGMMS